jgi:hypothetical protein
MFEAGILDTAKGIKMLWLMLFHFK